MWLRKRICDYFIGVLIRSLVVRISNIEDPEAVQKEGVQSNFTEGKIDPEFAKVSVIESLKEMRNSKRLRVLHRYRSVFT